MISSTVGWILSVVCMGLGGVLAVPLALAVVLGEPWGPFASAAGTGLCLGALLFLRFRGTQRSLSHRAAFLTVSLVWGAACAIGAIPFAIALNLHPVDALFESVSGFTTTGSTVLSGLDTLPRSLLLWRSMMQWLGGMGIVVFGVAILPLLGVGGMQLYKAEAPGPSKDKLTPRIAETAKVLWALYFGLTLVAAGFFYLDGMSVFDAVNHSMTAISTGGFSTHDESMGYFDSNLIFVVTTITMLAGGTSFAVLRRMLTGEFSWRDQPELRAYVAIFCVATAAITVDLSTSMSDGFPTLAGALTHASFQVASILTTTGYATSDFDRWPGVSHAVLLSLFFVGGMAGSTAGGPKVVRVVLLAKVTLSQVPRLLHRRAVVVVRLGKTTVDERALIGSLGFLSMWVLLLAVGTLALSASGTDLMSSLTAAAACLGNIGPGFGAVGPANTFASFDIWSKLVMQALMLLGRLEVYTLLVVLTPSFWRF